MRALIVYESIYGNTHVVANHIGAGLRREFEVDVVSVDGATADRVAGSGPVGRRGPDSRAQPVEHAIQAGRPRCGAQAGQGDRPRSGRGRRRPPGLVPRLGRHSARAAAAFDTRVDGPALLTGRASRSIARRLKGLGYRLAADPESFIVDNENHLLTGEADRAEAWAGSLTSYAPARA